MKSTKSRKLVSIGIVFLAIIIMFTVFLEGCAKSAANIAAKPITLVFTSHNSGTGYWKTNVIEPYFKELEKRTNGRVKVEQHWNGELVNLIDAYDAMLKGSVDLAEYFPSMLQGRFPMDDVVAFEPTDTFCYRPGRVIYELGQQFPKMLEPYNDAKLLWRQPAGSYGVVTTKTPIRDLASSKGLKIGPVGRWSSALIGALGWTPTAVPPEESTSALQTGVQDGTGISMYLLWEFGWGPIMKYLTYPIHVDEMLVNCSMNLKTWNSLPKDIQDTINGMSEWIVDLQDKAVLTNLIDSLPKATSEFKIEVIKLSDAEQAKFAAAAKPVQNDFVKSLNDLGLPGQALMDKFLELNKKYSDPQYAPK